MRTTLTLDDDIAAALKEQARLLDKPFRQVVNDALRRGMAPTPRTDRPAYRIKPLNSAFNPGIDTRRLNQLNDELQTAAFLQRGAE